MKNIFVNKSMPSVVFFWAAFFSSQVYGYDVLLNSGFILHNNTRESTAIHVNEPKTPLPEQSFSYPGFAAGFELPFVQGGFAVSGFLGVGFAENQVALSRHTIQGYEYRIKKSDGSLVNTINTPGVLQDFNLQEKVERHLRENDSTIFTTTRDVLIHATVLFKYSVPVNYDSSGSFLRYMSLTMNYLNPYIAGGFSNLMLNRKVALPQEIKNAIEAEHGNSILSSGEAITGKDPSPDPDFYLSWGLGMNIKIPQLKFFEVQTILTLEFLWHRSLSPDDMNSAYDDAYSYKQGGSTFRVATGILL